MAHSQKVRSAVIRGARKSLPGERSFSARVDLERREDCIYYTWRAESAEGEFLGSISQPVSFRVVTRGTDPFEFALAHAAESIRRYRVNREYQFKVTDVEWTTLAEPIA